MGDPNGIGPEVTLKALEQIGNSVSAVIIGSNNIIEETKTLYNIRWDGEIINCVDVDRKDIEYGKVSKIAGSCAYKSILKGYELVSSKEINTLVTAPICKTAVNLVHPSFYGHTELLASLSGTKRFAMLLIGDTVRVTLVTTHIPIKEVAQTLNSNDIVTKIELTHLFLTEKLGIRVPKIGVCALNPHAEEKIFGDEEKRVIVPAIEKAKHNGIDVSGPYPADTIFVRDTGFDAVVAMYHDQGMIPVKIKEFGGAVNVTLGLPFIRTSPDHGTAFEIAGKEIGRAHV